MGGTWDFAEVLFELASLGYGVEYALLNSSAFGVPQNRERIYIVGDLTARSIPSRRRQQARKPLEAAKEKYYLSEQQTERLLTRLLEARREAGSTAQTELLQLSLPEAEA